MLLVTRLPVTKMCLQVERHRGKGRIKRQKQQRRRAAPFGGRQRDAAEENATRPSATFYFIKILLEERLDLGMELEGSH